MKRVLLPLLKKLVKTDTLQKEFHEIYCKLHAGSQQSISLPSSKCRSAAPSTSPIFITSRFRSGSTLLWQWFRSTPSVTAYYEPFNSRKWFESRASTSSDETHVGVTDYGDEYQHLHLLNERPEWDDSWPTQQLYMSARCPGLRMKSYIDFLIKHSIGRPTLQFNRVDYRLPWLRAVYPEALIVHLRRCPRSQWISTFQKTKPPELHAKYSARKFGDEFYMINWVEDLKCIYPIFRECGNWHPYQVSYLLWSLSNHFADAFADISIHYEQMISKPTITQNTIASISGISDFAIEFNNHSIHGNSTSRWKSYAGDDWFYDKESEVDEVFRRIFVTN